MVVLLWVIGYWPQVTHNLLNTSHHSSLPSLTGPLWVELLKRFNKRPHSWGQRIILS